jgi:hypothetical protein
MSSSSSNAVTSADSPSKVSHSPAPPFSHSIPRRTAANRENATKSTGPRTKEGKARSALNALVHGGFADKLILPNENQELFAAFYADTLNALRPANALELSLAQRIVSLDWRLRRIQAADTAFHIARFERFQHNADHFAKTTQGQRLKTEDPHLAPYFDAANLPEGFTLAYTYDPPATDTTTPTAGENPFERLAKTEHRLANMLHRAIKDLQSLQKSRLENPAPDNPDDDDDPIDDDQIDDAEPTDNEEASPASAGGSSTPQDPNPLPSPQSAPSRPTQTQNAQNEPMCHSDTPITSPHTRTPDASYDPEAAAPSPPP